MAGLKHATYNATVVDIADLTVERYFSDFRAAFTVLPAHSSTAGNATSYRFQFGYYYGEENASSCFSPGALKWTDRRRRPNRSGRRPGKPRLQATLAVGRWASITWLPARYRLGNRTGAGWAFAYPLLACSSCFAYWSHSPH